MIILLLILQGIIEPHSVKEVSLHITAECLDEVTTVAYFMIFGSSDAPLVSNNYMHLFSMINHSFN